MHGIIVRKIEPRGFGFIRADGGEEYFFAYAACRVVEFVDLHVGR